VGGVIAVGMEGKPNRFQERIQVFKHQMVPVTKNPKSLRVQSRCSFIVFMIAQHMLAAVQLDDQLRLETDEIDDVWTNRRLLSKLEPTELPAAQPRP
jgi:hypothetical protein